MKNCQPELTNHTAPWVRLGYSRRLSTAGFRLSGDRSRPGSSSCWICTTIRWPFRVLPPGYLFVNVHELGPVIGQLFEQDPSSYSPSGKSFSPRLFSAGWFSFSSSRFLPGIKSVCANTRPLQFPGCYSWDLPATWTPLPQNLHRRYYLVPLHIHRQR